jgi:hypothetical protein
MRSISLALSLLLFCGVAAQAEQLVEVSGAVRSPGPYLVRDNATSRDAIQAAGGLRIGPNGKPVADLKAIKLDQLLVRTGSKIRVVVPFQGEFAKVQEKKPAVAASPIAKAAVAIAPPPAQAPVTAAPKKEEDVETKVRSAIDQVRKGADPQQKAGELATQIKPEERIQAWPILQEAGNASEVPVRKLVVLYVAQTRDQQGVGLLIKSLKDSDSGLRELAGATLPNMVAKK